MSVTVSLIVIIVLFICIMAMSRKKPSQRPPVQPAQPRPEAPAPGPAAAVREEPFCRASGAEEKANWDSEGDYHEGEDPCHAESLTAPAPEPDEETESAMPSEEAQEMLRGIVWSEILTRKRR